MTNKNKAYIIKKIFVELIVRRLVQKFILLKSGYSFFALIFAIDFFLIRFYFIWNAKNTRKIRFSYIFSCNFISYLLWLYYSGKPPLCIIKLLFQCADPIMQVAIFIPQMFVRFYSIQPINWTYSHIKLLIILFILKMDFYLC